MKKIVIITLYILFFWFVLPGGMICSAILLDEWQKMILLNFTWIRIVGVMLVIVAGVSLGISVNQFKKFSKRLPVSAYPPESLLRQGLFAWWRHPIYLFYALLLLGIGLFWGSKSFLIIIFPIFLFCEFIYLRLEETILMKRFGTAYQYYRQTTGLIIPRLSQLLKIPFFFIFRYFFSYQTKYEIPNMPAPPYFIISYHRNYFDPFLISKSLPHPVAYVTTYEMFRQPVARYIFTKLFCIPNRRFRSDLHAVRRILQTIQHHGVVGIFPEGERRWTGTAGLFKPTALKLLRQFPGIPVIPIKIQGNYHAWPRWGKSFRRAEITVTIARPIHFQKNDSILMIEKTLRNVLHTEDDPSFCHSKNLIHDIGEVLYRCPVCMAFQPVSRAKDNHFTCFSCKTVFTLKPDYSVHFLQQNKSIDLTIDNIYRQIRISEKDIRPRNEEDRKQNLPTLDKNEYLIVVSSLCQFFVNKKERFFFVSTGKLLLSNKNIRLAASPEFKLPLHQIRSLTIEGRKKLQIFVGRTASLYQFIFPTESALKWQDFICVTIEKECKFSPNRI